MTRTRFGWSPAPTSPAGLARTCRAAAARDVYQRATLQALAHAAGSTVSYVKPHGALYNTVVNHEDQARAVAQAVHAVDLALTVVGLAGSAASLGL